jgi:hypothetical protein
MIVLYLLGALVGLVVLMALIGLALPRGHLASRTTTLVHRRDDVWRALTDLEAQPTWRRGLKKLERLDAGRFRETTSHGAILYEVVEERAPERRVTRIADDKLPFGGRWIYELEPAGDGTKLTITEDGFVKNPIFRFLSKTVFSTTATIEKFLADLKTHLDKA